MSRTSIDNWRKSSFSDATSDCVEYGSNHDVIGFRDTKQAGLVDGQPTLLIPRQAGRSFREAVKRDALTA